MRGEAARQQAPGGLGLGLALVKRLAELHGGSAAVASSGAGTGTEFVVRIPFTAPQAQAAAPPAQHAARPGAALSVAIVEDNAEVCESLRQLLDQSSDFTCACACRNGESALRRIPAVAPAAVILDIQLPGMSGIDRLSALKRRMPAASPSGLPWLVPRDARAHR